MIGASLLGQVSVRGLGYRYETLLSCEWQTRLVFFFPRHPSGAAAALCHTCWNLLPILDGPSANLLAGFVHKKGFFAPGLLKEVPERYCYAAPNLWGALLQFYFCPHCV